MGDPISEAPSQELSTTFLLLATQFGGGIWQTETAVAGWEDNIKMNHLETEQEGGESADLDQDKVK